MVAQVDEQQLAMVAPAVHPAGEFYLLADIGLFQLAAMVGAVGMHERVFQMAVFDVQGSANYG